jgi:hypothetical protein
MEEISLSKAEQTLHQLGWFSKMSLDGQFKKWYSSEGSANIILPSLSEDFEGDKDYYLHQLVSCIIKYKNIEDDINSFDDILSQINTKSYVIESVVEPFDNNSLSAPYEFATSLVSLNINSFSHFNKINFNLKNDDYYDLELGHTKKGSFIIPVKIPVKEDFPSNMGVLSHTAVKINQYVSTLSSLGEVSQIKDKSRFADEALNKGINSNIVANFALENAPRKNYIKLLQKYSEKVKKAYIRTQPNIFLDNLIENEPRYAYLDGLSPIKEDLYRDLINAEVSNDALVIPLTKKVIIECDVQQINLDHISDFLVLRIATESKEEIKFKKSFRARAQELSDEHLDICKNAFKNSSVIIKGDIEKKRGKMASIWVTSITLKDGGFEKYLNILPNNETVEIF